MQSSAAVRSCQLQKSLANTTKAEYNIKTYTRVSFGAGGALPGHSQTRAAATEGAHTDHPALGQPQEQKTTLDQGPPPSRRRGGYAAGRRRREQIVAEAARQFSQLGFNQATVFGIAEACGISRAGLLHHFPTKEALLAAVLEARDEADRARFRRHGPPDPTGLHVLKSMVALSAHNAQVPGIIGLYALLSAEATAPDHPAHDYFVRRYHRIREGTERVLERAAAHGLLRPEIQPARAAAQLTALMDGLQSSWLLDPASVDMAAELQDAIERMLTVRLDAADEPCGESHVGGDHPSRDIAARTVKSSAT